MPRHMHTLTEEELFCLLGCRKYPQYYRMRKGFEQNRCQFCDLDRTLNIVLYEDEHVMVWEIPEAFKRKELREQYLVVPKRHIRFPWEVTHEEHESFRHALRWLGSNVTLRGGMIFARFGDMSLNAGTVPHLHWNIWVPLETDEVRIPVYKKVDDLEASKKRAAVFAADYEAGVIP